MSPKTLSDSPEDIVRDLISDNWGNPSVSDGGYVERSDPKASDALVITTDWSGFGETYPAITLTNKDPNVPGGGDTNITGIQGDGSGSNQRRLETMLMTVKAKQLDDGDYQGQDAHGIVKTLYDHAFQIVWNNQNAPNHAEVTAFYATPGAHTTPNTEDSTVTEQYSGNVTVDWTKTP